jgi:hypothetical protein
MTQIQSIAMSRWLWGVRGTGVALVAAAWIGLRSTDEMMAFGVALALSPPLAALLLGPPKRCLSAGLGFGIAVLALLIYAMFLPTGRDVGLLYFGPLLVLGMLLAGCAVLGGGQPTYAVAFVAYALLSGLWLTFVDALDSEVRVIPAAAASSTLREVSRAEGVLAAAGSGYTADLPAIARMLQSEKDPPKSSVIEALRNSRDGRFSLHQYQYVFRLTPGGFEMTAQPDRKRWRGFFVDQTGVIRDCPGHCTATAKDRPI